MDSITINVTESHISNGLPEEANACAIALAIQEARPDAKYIEVEPNDIPNRSGYAVVDGVTYDLPKEANSFAMEFDRTGDVTPATFTLTKSATEHEPSPFFYDPEADGWLPTDD